MKRHIKLFEDFSQEATPMRQAKGNALWALMFHPDAVMYGVYQSPAEANAAKKMMNDYIEAGFKAEYGEDEPYDQEAEDMIDVQRVTVGKNSKTDGMLFSYAMNASLGAADWPGQKPQEMVKTLIMAGADPFKAFDGPEEVLKFFRGDISWMPEGPIKTKLLRMKKGKSAFGM